MIVESKSQPVELDNSTIELHVLSRRKKSLQLYCSVDFDFLALMRFDMNFDATLLATQLSVNLQIRVIKNVSFSLLLVTFSIKANFEKEYLWNSIYLRFPGSLVLAFVTFFSQVKKKIPLKLN